MSFAQTFCDVTLRMSPDLLARLDRYDYLKNLRTYLQMQQVWPGINLEKIGLPTPLAYPEFELNSYFYPTGASRWSVICSLVTAAELAAMELVVWAGPTPVSGKFVMKSTGGDSVGGIETYLTMLPPIPVAGVFNGLPASPGLPAPVSGETYTVYLITLVDERYFWHQFADGGVIQCYSATNTWSKLLDQLATQLGITLTYAVPDATYGVPEPDSAIYSNYESPAVLLDAVAANVGCAVVRTGVNAYKLQRFVDGIAATESNRPASGNNLTGGRAIYQYPRVDTGYQAILPQSVKLTFPKWIDGAGYYEPTDFRDHTKTESYGAVYSKTYSLADLGAPYDTYNYFLGTKVFHTTAKAIFTSPGDVAPVNVADCNALADLVARDYYNSKTGWLDESYAGIYPWTPECISDLLFTWRGTEVFTPQVMPPPFNAGASEFQHGFGPLAVPSPDGITVRDDKGGFVAGVDDVTLNNSVVTDDGGGAATWTIDNTDGTHPGIVSLAAQVIGAGIKKFLEIIYCGKGWQVWLDDEFDPDGYFCKGQMVTLSSTAEDARAFQFAVSLFEAIPRMAYFYQPQDDVGDVDFEDTTQTTFIAGEHFATDGFSVSPSGSKTYNDRLPGDSGTDPVGNVFRKGILVTRSTGLISANVRAGTQAVTILSGVTYNITFGTVMPDANYSISLSTSDPTAIVGWSSKANSGFTITLSAAIDGDVDYVATAYT